VDPTGHAYPALHGPLQVDTFIPVTSPYRPPGHPVHDAAPDRLYVPTGHTTMVTLVDPTGHMYPAGQGPLHVDEVNPPVWPYWPAVHCPVQLEEVRPADVPYRPAGHGPVHDEDVRPVASPYCPAGQLVHDDEPTGLNFPTGHIVTEALVDPTGHAYPALHGPLHVDTFILAVSPYRPARQLEHDAAPDRLYVPMGHAATVSLVDPAGHVYPAAQGLVHADEFIPLTEPDRPAAHCPVQLEEVMPVDAPYRPAGHGPEHDGVVKPTAVPY
jgi:hypothetical protein